MLIDPEVGVAYLRGAVDVAGIEDAIWAFFGDRGVVRADASTWPSSPYPESKSQTLRRARTFEAFGSATVRAAVADVLGEPWHVEALRMFGFVNEVGRQGRGTLVIEGSHELIRRRVCVAPDHDAGTSAQVKKQLRREHRLQRCALRRRRRLDGLSRR